MQFTIQREALLKPLQLVAGVVERRQTRRFFPMSSWWSMEIRCR